MAVVGQAGAARSSGTGAGVGSGAGVAARAAGADVAAAGPGEAGPCRSRGCRNRCGTDGRNRRTRRRQRGTLHLESALQPVQPSQHGGLVTGSSRQQHPGADQLEHQSRSRGAPHLDQAGVEDVASAGELGRAQPGCLHAHALELVLGRVEQTLAGRVGHRLEDQQVAHPLEQVSGEASRVVPALDHPVDDLEDGRPVTGSEGVHHLIEQRGVSESEQRHGTGVGQALRTCAGEQLVEHGERVAGRPCTGAYDEREHQRVDLDALLIADVLHQAEQLARRHQPERVVVGARTDRPDDLLGLGRGEDELQVGRRLLDQLEQGVEALPADHVRLVDDVDLVRAGDGRVEGAFAQVPGVVHTTVGRGVDLDDVKAAGTVGREGDARVAHAAGVGRRSLVAVERPGQDAGTRGLAAPARAGEQVGVVDLAVADRLLQRPGHVVLPDDLTEGAGAVLAVEGEAHAGKRTSPVRRLWTGAIAGLWRTGKRRQPGNSTHDRSRQRRSTR